MKKSMYTKYILFFLLVGILGCSSNRGKVIKKRLPSAANEWKNLTNEYDLLGLAENLANSKKKLRLVCKSDNHTLYLFFESAADFKNEELLTHFNINSGKLMGEFKTGSYIKENAELYLASPHYGSPIRNIRIVKGREGYTSKVFGRKGGAPLFEIRNCRYDMINF